MKNKWTKVTLLSTVVIASLGLGTVAQADQIDQTVEGKAVTEFQAPGITDPVDPTDPENPDPEPIVPVDPTDPTPPVYPGGPLRLNHIPTINFGSNEISAKEATYMARFEEVIDVSSGTRAPKASFVEVADLTGTLRGWKVTVASDGIFHAEKDKGTPIKGIITLKGNDDAVRGLHGMDEQKDMFPTANKNIVIGGGTAQSVEVLTADKGKGMNKWQVRYGSHKDTGKDIQGVDDTYRNANVTLRVPQGQVVLEKVPYTAKVTWNLLQGL